MSRRRNRIGVGAVLTALALVALACGSDDDGGSAGDTTATTAVAAVGEPGGKVVYGLIAETNNWDPTAGNWGPWSLIVANALFDTLARYDAEGRVEPYLAEGFYPSQDYSQWRIKTREGVTFHNGEPLDAQAIVDNLEFHRQSPLTGSVFDEVTEVEIIDERNVRVALSEPVVQFPGIFATQVGVVMAPAMIGNPNRGTEPVGTGPFMLDEWIPDSHMVLVKNPGYWQTDGEGNALPYLDEIEFRPIPDDQARADSLRSGELDIAQINVAPELAAFRDSSDFQVLGDPESEEDESFVMLNTAVPPFDQAIARQALAYATDREDYNDALNEGKGQIAEGPFRPASPWYHDVDYPSFDPDRARELVAEYEAQFGPFEFSLLSSPRLRVVQGAQLLQQQWADVGIDATIESTETASQISSVAVGDYQATIWQQFGSAHPFLEEAWWSCEYVEPIPEIGLNFARWCNEELTDQMEQARANPAGVELSEDGAAIVASDELKPYYDRVQEILAEDVPYVWLYHIETGAVATPEVRDVLSFTLPSGAPGLAFNNGAHPLHQIWLDRG